MFISKVYHICIFSFFGFSMVLQQKHTREYGKIFKSHFGPQFVVSIADRDMVAQVLRAEGAAPQRANMESWQEYRHLRGRSTGLISAWVCGPGGPWLGGPCLDTWLWKPVFNKLHTSQWHSGKMASLRDLLNTGARGPVPSPLGRGLMAGTRSGCTSLGEGKNCFSSSAPRLSVSSLWQRREGGSQSRSVGRGGRSSCFRRHRRGAKSLPVWIALWCCSHLATGYDYCL